MDYAVDMAEPPLPSPLLPHNFHAGPFLLLLRAADGLTAHNLQTTQRPLHLQVQAQHLLRGQVPAGEAMGALGHFLARNPRNSHSFVDSSSWLLENELRKVPILLNRAGIFHHISSYGLQCDHLLKVAQQDDFRDAAGAEKVALHARDVRADNANGASHY